MKMFFTLAVLLFSSVTFAAEIKIFDTVPYFNYGYVTSKFEINRDLGRAWVEIEVQSANMEEMSDYYRQRVDGLSFDGEKIVFEHEGQLIECATVKRKGRGIFKRESIKNTNCEFKSKEVLVLRDNGFEIVKEKHLQVFLVTKHSLGAEK